MTGQHQGQGGILNLEVGDPDPFRDRGGNGPQLGQEPDYDEVIAEAKKALG